MEVHMATNVQVPEDPGKGYFEKNFARLKEFQHYFYMISRIVMVLVGGVLAGFFLFESWYFHSPTGVANKYLWVTGSIFLASGLRKSVIRLIQLGDNLKTQKVEEKPYDARESVWMRIGFRMPFGIRRGLVGAIALCTEAFAAILMLFSWISAGLNHGLFMLSNQFPFVMKPVALIDWTFPENFHFALMIALGALGISWINHLVFVLKYPKVRNAALGVASQVAGLIKGPLGGAVSKLFEFGQKIDAQITSADQEALAAKLIEVIDAHVKKE